MFAQNPVFGVGAAQFGACSCTGPGWYPHSTLLQGFAELGLVGGGMLAGLLAFAALTLARPIWSARQESNGSAYAFALALFATLLVADQFYGTYFMSVGAWLMVGVAAAIRAQAKQEGERHG